MSKAKQIGTRAETAVKNVLLGWGYTPLEAHRNVLKGSLDEGDVWLRSHRGLIVFEVKGGDRAKKASPQQIDKWMVETETERKNADGRIGVLVTQRAGVGYPRAGEWWAYLRLSDALYLRDCTDAGEHNRGPVIRMRLDDVMELFNGK